MSNIAPGKKRENIINTTTTINTSSLFLFTVIVPTRPRPSLRCVSCGPATPCCRRLRCCPAAVISSCSCCCGLIVVFLLVLVLVVLFEEDHHLNLDEDEEIGSILVVVLGVEVCWCMMVTCRW